MGSVLIVILMALAGIFAPMLMPSQPPAAASSVQTVEAPQVLSCIDVSSPSADIDIMNTLVSDTFKTDDWTQSLNYADLRTSSTWLSNQHGAVAYLEILHYDCGVTEAQIDAYFTSNTFDVFLGNYLSHELTAQCSAKSLRLYEFAATMSNGSHIDIQLWVEQVSPTRVIDLMLGFPADADADQAAYAGQLFPQLPSCAPAAG